MPFVVRSFPLRRPAGEIEEFAAELAGTRRRETDRFYRQYGVSHESWYLQETPFGSWVIAVTQIADPEEAAPRYRDASEDFHRWFKDMVLRLTGIDPNLTPLGPPTREVFSWDDDAAGTKDR